ncbi:MAG TPA: hypothetical protein VFK19_13015 [Sphingomicrobium sp.]|nr:hypothetical protein [Sphingomicrobium sp.]
MWTAFDYMYRDAGNFKAFGTVILEGELRAPDREIIHSRLESDEFFIAEQVGVPPLYHELYRWSDGPTKEDHCWHEFVGFREIADHAEGRAASTTAEFVDRFAAVKDWNETLSPHVAIGSC